MISNINKDTHRLLQIWSSHAATFKWLHDRSAKMLRSKNRSLMIPTLILNSVCGMMVYRTDLFKDSKTALVLFECIVGSLNLACVILNGVRDYSQYAEKAELHHQSFQQWARFKNEIYVELVAPSEEKVETFIIQMKIKYIDIINSTPTIPNDIIAFYEKEISNNKPGYTLPDIIDGMSNFKPFDIDLDEENQNMILGDPDNPDLTASASLTT